MNDKQKIFLLSLARNTIKEYLYKKKHQVIDENNIDKIFLEKRGVFVTLHKNNKLRGCIGYILPYKALYISVIENAYNSAFEDPRFSALSKKEFDKINIEISVLTVPKKVDSYKDIVIGKHGIFLESGEFRSVFLPQVAPENNWDLETTLTNLSMKASGNPNLWKQENAEFEVFEAEIFSEKQYEN